jgi:hypothetical protein
MHSTAERSPVAPSRTNRRKYFIAGIVLAHRSIVNSAISRQFHLGVRVSVSDMAMLPSIVVVF